MAWQDDLTRVTSSSRWQSAATEQRKQFAREIVMATADTEDEDPEDHRQFADALYGATGPGIVSQAADFVGTGLKEAALSVPAMGGAVALGVAAPVQSFERLKAGGEALMEGTVGLAKELVPGSYVNRLDAVIGAVKDDIDSAALPSGVKDWLAGDAEETDLDEPSRNYVQTLNSKLAQYARLADKGVDSEEGRTAWMKSDRSPLRIGAADDGADDSSARDLLADYAATRDPDSFDAFRRRVTESDTQYQARITAAREAQAAKANQRTDAPAPGILDTMAADLSARAKGMQESPLDLATVALPLLRGAKALKAVKQGAGIATVAKTLAKDATSEAVQEGGTELLMDRRNTAGDVTYAAGLGAVGGVGFTAVGQIGGALDGGRSLPALPVLPRTVETITDDLGELTAEEVADIESQGTPRQPILQGVADLPNPDLTAPGGDRSPLQSPYAPVLDLLPEGTGQSPLLPAPATPESAPIDFQESFSSEQSNTPPQTPQSAAAPDPASITNIGSRAAVGAGKARSRPVIPDSPLGAPDLLDFLNDNPIGAPSELELSNENWEAQTQIPKKLRKFITDPQSRQAPEQVAEAAFANNLIDAPTPDALIAKINEVSAARESAAALAKDTPKNTKAAEKASKQFAKTQQQLAKQPGARAVPLDDLRTGDVLTLAGQRYTVASTQPGPNNSSNDQVTLRSPEGADVVLNNDEEGSGAVAADTAPDTIGRPSNGAGGTWADNTIAAAQGTPFIGLDPILMTAYTIKGAQLIKEGFTSLAKWSAEMLRRFGENVRAYLADAWRAAQKTSRKGAININATNAKPPAGTGPQSTAPTPPKGFKETASRFARPEAQDRWYKTRADEDVAAVAAAYLDSHSLEQAVEDLDSDRLPVEDWVQQVAGKVLTRTIDLMRSGSEAQRVVASALHQRAAVVWQGRLSQEAGRALRQRHVVNDELMPYAPIMAAEKSLIDRAEALMDNRFEGGAAGAAQQVQATVDAAGAEAGQDLAEALGEETQDTAAQDARVKDLEDRLKKAQQDLTSQRNTSGTFQRIMDLFKNAGGRKSAMLTSLKDKAKDLRRAAMARKAARRAEGRLSMNPIDDLADDAVIGMAIMAEGVVEFSNWSQALIRELGTSVTPYLDRLYEQSAKLFLDEVEKESRVQASKPKTKAKPKTGKDGESKAKRLAEQLLKLGPNPQAVKDQIRAAYEAQVKTPKSLAAFQQQLAKLGVTPETAAKLHDIAALDTASRARVGAEAESLRNQNSADALVKRLNFTGPALKAQTSAIREAYDAQVKTPQILADFQKTMAQLGVNAATAKQLHEVAELQTTSTARVKAEARAAEAQKLKQSLITSGLTKLLDQLRKKMAPGMTWAEIFTELPSDQKARQRAMYERLKKDQRLANLTAEERLKLTNELDKAWQQQRRKVFVREMQKVGAMGKKPSDRQRVINAMPKLLRFINLGVMSASAFRDAVAEQYGLRTMSDSAALKLRDMAEEAYKLPEGVLRNRKLADLLTAMQHATGSSRAQLLGSYWVASVLSGLRTQFVVAISAWNGFQDNLIQAAGLLKDGKGRDALAAHSAWWRGLNEGIRDSWQILSKGDYSVLKRFNEDLGRTLQGQGNWRAVPLGEALWKNGSALSKAPAAVMLFTGRLMAAFDHITNTATTEGAKVVARAMNPELYKTAAPTAQEVSDATRQATLEVTGGTPPTTSAERATIRVRVREILNGLMTAETQAEASFIGDQAALQNDPIGLLGGIYENTSAWLGNFERILMKQAQKVDEGTYVGKTWRATLMLLSGIVRPTTGTSFLRAGANVGNQYLSYIPGTYLFSKAGQALGNLERTKSQNQLLAGRNVVGAMAAYAIASLFVGKDDEEEGWHGEGNWGNLSKEEKALRRAAGIEPGTFWKRENGKIRRIAYRDMPLAGIFASVLGAQDLYREDPAKFAARGLTEHITHGLASGLMQVKDANAMGTLMEALGASSYSQNPEEDFIRKVVKLPMNWVGGLIPTALKDAEIWTDSRLYKPEGVIEEFLKQVPIARRFVGGGQPQVDRLGDDIQLNRAPWSRLTTVTDSSIARNRLAQLLARGIHLPGVSTDKLITRPDGSRTKLENLGPKAETDYLRAVGKAYKDYLTSEEGVSLMSLPPEQAEKLLSRKDELFKAQAVQKLQQGLR